jgi:uncharacterized membrane protein
LTISEIKKSAKVKLTGSYLRCASSTLLYFIITLLLTYLQKICTNAINNSIVITLIEAIFVILKLILSYGLIANIIKLVDIKTNSITDFLNIAIQNTSKYLKTMLIVIFKLLIPLVIFILAGFYLIGNLIAYQNNIKYFCFSPNLVLPIVIFIIACVILLYFFLKYMLVPYIYYKQPELSPSEIVKKSNTIMKNKKLQLFLLLLSFANWFLIVAIILLILNLFIPIEYLTTVVVIFYSLLKPYIAISKLEFYESLGE